jgi:hypothetical protein
MQEDLFYSLSIDLTGEPKLNRLLAAGLLSRLREAPEASALDELLRVYEGILAEPSGHNDLIRERIMKVDALRGVAKMIIVLWYTGDLLSIQPSALSEAEYFQGIVWQVAHAHAPGLSGGYFGHWTYPPDN